MVKQELETALQEYSRKAARHLPVVCDWDGKRRYVTVRDLRDAETLMLEFTEQFEDTAGVINDLLAFWETPKASVFVDTGGGILRSVESVGMETKNWNNLLGWQECVLVEVA